MLRGGREIRGRTDWPTAPRCPSPPSAANAASNALRDRMRRHAQADAVLAAGDGVVDVRGAWQDQRQRSRPERGRERGAHRRETRAPSARLAPHAADARSPDDRRAGPWPRRSGARHRDCLRPRPGHRPFRSETRRVRRRAGAAPRCDRGAVGAAIRPLIAGPARLGLAPVPRTCARRKLLEFELLRSGAPQIALRELRHAAAHADRAQRGVE